MEKIKKNLFRGQVGSDRLMLPPMIELCNMKTNRIRRIPTGMWHYSVKRKRNCRNWSLLVILPCHFEDRQCWKHPDDFDFPAKEERDYVDRNPKQRGSKKAIKIPGVDPLCFSNLRKRISILWSHTVEYSTPSQNNRRCSFFLQKIWSQKPLWRSLVSIPASLALPSRFVNLNQTKNSFPIIVRLWPFLKRPLVKSDIWLNEWFIGSRCPLYWASKNKTRKM